MTPRRWFTAAFKAPVLAITPDGRIVRPIKTTAVVENLAGANCSRQQDWPGA